MQTWQIASLGFFAYVALVGVLPRRRRVPRPGRLLAASAAGLAFSATIAWVPYDPVLHDWIAPPIALLFGYWASGLLFVAPIPAQERLLGSIDERLGILCTARRFPAPLAALLETAYVGVYPIVPIALALQHFFLPHSDPARFWAVVLVTDYMCFGVLPWVQTRPPRALEPVAPWDSAVRRFNRQLLSTASIQMNTFPSGHAAEALAVALLLIGAPWPIVLVMFGVALAISAGAVYGRYHYAADALAGWVVAVGVWLAL